MGDLVDVGWPPAVDIRTQRLVIRPARARDRAGYIDLLASADVRQYLGGARPREELEGVVPMVPGAYPGFFAVEVAGRFAGMVMLTHRDAELSGHVRPEGNELEVSYTFLPNCWGQCYATEAVRAVLAWVAPSVRDIDVILCTQVAKDHSVRLAGRLGFSEVEHFHEHGAWQWLGARELRQSQRTERER